MKCTLSVVSFGESRSVSGISMKKSKYYCALRHGI